MNARLQQRSGWILKGGIAIAMALIACGCAPASSISYNRHLHMSHAPQHVNAAALDAAHRMAAQPQGDAVLAGAMADEPRRND